MLSFLRHLVRAEEVNRIIRRTIRATRVGLTDHGP